MEARLHRRPHLGLLERRPHGPALHLPQEEHVSDLTVRRVRTDTREPVGTVRVTVHLTASEFAGLVVNDSGAALFPENHTAEGFDISADALRDAVAGAIFETLEQASYRIGDNGAQELTDAVTARIQEQHFPAHRPASR